MGVKECNRFGCNSIMCDHYSSIYGYICYDCLSEMKDTMTDPYSFGEFMTTSKRMAVFDKETIENAIDLEFKMVEGGVI